MGAIASGGVQVVNEQVVGRLGLGEADLRRVAEAEARELARRERSYREGRAPPDLAGRVVILVDDGLATGSTMRAAVAAARRLGPARVVVAVPTAPASTCQRLRGEADEVVCATTPRPFRAVGYSYRSFPQTSDEEVRALLRSAWARAPDARGQGADATDPAGPGPRSGNPGPGPEGLNPPAPDPAAPDAPAPDPTGSGAAAGEPNLNRSS
jgi:predicted phosphoribosyltransferase